MDISFLLKELQGDFYTGVPDSQLRALCDYLTCTMGISSKHIIAANEGNCVAIAAGYYLATGNIPIVYMQNSGIGNIVNPVASLLNEKVYGIPCVFLVGWRGEPTENDEPQHVFQGEVSQRLLEDIGLYTIVLGEDTPEAFLKEKIKSIHHVLSEKKSVAFLIKKGALQNDKQMLYKNCYDMRRELVIEHIIDVAGQDIVVSTTGKASRELFEIREKKAQGHQCDFMTVGSMGHSSSIALGIALNKPSTRIWCIDGDGAVLMHMGALAVIGSNQPSNMIHIVINNEAHESVGGMPTVACNINLRKIAEGCGYKFVSSVQTYEELDEQLLLAKERKVLSFIEVKCSIGSRKDLGRPTTTPQKNKDTFMRYLHDKD